ncbi:MAG: cupredoxin domain-containing protein [Chloroflexota bacterium]|nr:cupredoxin domain-containing protein [Chloroflexota bacterium]
MVTFVNQDGDDHTATGAGFDTGLILERGGSASVVFDTPGSFPFACLIHPEMTGEIRVRDETGTVPARAAASPVAATPTAGGTGEIAVEIIDLAFEPPALAVPVGATVVWTNAGQVPHTVTADDFSSEVLEPSQEFRHTFAAAGTFDYLCAIHPQMTGQVRVDPA